MLGFPHGARQKPQSQINRTGIPNQMKMDFENRCGVSLDDVHVYYHSNMLAKLGALVYTKGTQVYIGTEQEHCLKHELGHKGGNSSDRVPEWNPS